jgi:hypothetical protein
MQQRGRKSARSKETAAVIVSGVDFGGRPPPPEQLTPIQAEIWRATVASEPADFFNSAVLKGLLTDYCRHRAVIESVSKIVDAFQAEWLKSAEGAKRYQALLKIREAECRAAADKATKLRLTNQARYTPKTAATAARKASSAMPWDFDGEAKA